MNRRIDKGSPNHEPSWDLRLAAAVEFGVRLLETLGFAGECESLREAVKKAPLRVENGSVERAVRDALASVDSEALGRLAGDGRFQAAAVQDLLMGRIEALTSLPERRTPAGDREIRRFFDAFEKRILAEPSWGSVVGRLQESLFRPEMENALNERLGLREPSYLISRFQAELDGSGALVQGSGNVAAGKKGVAVGGNLIQFVQVFVEQWASGRAAGGSARSKYLNDLALDCERLPWSRVHERHADAEGETGRPLSEIYTDLDTTNLRQVTTELEYREFLGRMQETERVPILDAANAARCLLVLGDPGSGKSTFTKHLAYILAKAGVSEDPGSWLQRLQPWEHGSVLPIRVELRRLAEWLSKEKTSAGDRHAFLRFLESMLAGLTLQDYWPELRETLRDRSETALVLLDGLDEVTPDLRPKVVDCINDLAGSYHRHRYLVTTRPYAYLDQSLCLEGFRQVTLAPFSPGQIRNFIDNWYRRIETREGPEDFKSKRGDLIDALKRPDLQDLARRPLLLTIMAQLHTFEGTLPEDRTELFEKAVTLLLEVWERDRSSILEHVAVPGLKKNHVLEALWDVAYKAHEGGQAEDQVANIEENLLRMTLADRFNKDLPAAERFVEYIRERAGLLVPHRTGGYAFPHRCFQEFLAACQLTGWTGYSEKAVGLLEEGFDRWREVFVLAAGYAARHQKLGQAIDVVNRLWPERLAKGAQPPTEVKNRAFVASEALLEIGLFDVESDIVGGPLLRRLREWLASAIRRDKELGPRERAEAGRLLGRLDG